MTANARPRIFYGWIIAGVISLAWAISVGPRQAFPVFLVAYLTDFGASRSLAAAAFSIHMTSYALGGWILGALADRLGPKRVITWSMVTWLLVLLLCGLARDLWQLYIIFGVIGGVATSGLAYVPNNALLSRWFIRYRGMAMGITQAGVPLGAAVAGPLAQLGIASVGWRWTHVGFGVLIAITALPLVLVFLRDDPREKGLAPDGIPPDAQEPVRSSVRAPRAAGFAGPGIPQGYWPVFVANALRGVTMYAIAVHQVAYLVDAGYTRMAAASFFSLGSFIAGPAGFLIGAVSDRLGRPRAYAGIAGLYAVSYLSLLLVSDPSQVVFLSIFILAYGTATGGVSPVFAAFLTDRLQGPSLGYLIGLQNLGFGIGAMLGPFLAGVLFDRLKSYTAAFVLIAASMILSSAIISVVARRTAKGSG